MPVEERQASTARQSASACHGRGLALANEGRWDEAEALLQRAAAEDPSQLQYTLDYAALLVGCGKIAESIAEYQRAMQRHPCDPAPYGQLGLLVAQLGRMNDAAPLFRKALDLDPGTSAHWVNYGKVVRELGGLEEAIACFEEAVALDGSNAAACNCLGEAWQARGDKEAAARWFRQAADLAPGDGETLANLGLALLQSGHHGRAREALARAVELAPSNGRILSSLATACRDMLDTAEAVRLMERAADLSPEDFKVVSKYLYTLNFSDRVTAGRIQEEHRRINRCFAQQAPRPKAAPLGGRPARIGFLSGDFRSHSVAFFLLPLLEAMDRDRFELYAFSETEDQDAMSGRLRRRFDGWDDTLGLSATQAAELIRQRGIDLLIDLAGHTAGARPDALAERPAPIQISWLGYPHRHGLRSMDGRIVDATTDPEAMDIDPASPEKLLRLEEGFLCYRPLEGTPAIRETPCLENGYITFGSFNNLAKLTETAIRLWASAMKKVPRSRLLLKSGHCADESIRRVARERFAACGIDGERLMFAGRTSSYREHMGRYGEIDIALDPFPYHGTTTTCEALWMGVPVVSLQGDRHVSRVGGSLLAQVGLSKLAAESAEGFSSIVSRLSSDRHELNEIRLGMRERLQSSSLMDADGFARRFERLLDGLLGRGEAAAGPMDEELFQSQCREALALHRRGELRGAALGYRRLLEARPHDCEVAKAAGVAHYGLGDFRRAESLLGRASRGLAADAELWSHLGCARQKLGWNDEAVDAHRRAVALKPRDALILSNFGNALLQSGQAAEAVPVFREALSTDEGAAAVWSNLANALKQSGELDAATEAACRATQADKGFAGGHLNLGSLRMAGGDSRGALESFRCAARLEPAYGKAWSNLIYAHHYSDTSDNRMIAEACRGYARSLGHPSALPPQARAGAGRKRLGLVSSDFREHAVARFLLPLLEHCDRKEWELFLYHESAAEDGVTARLRQLSDVWRPIRGAGDDEVAQRIRQDGIDALIDLNGHSSGHRLGVFARRPAAVQFTYLGFPGSTGLSQIDYRIADRVAVSDDEASLFPEKTLYLENGYHTIAFPGAPSAQTGPSQRGERFTFGSFNNAAKLSDATLRAWGSILAKAGDARLAVKCYQLRDPAFRRRLTDRMERCGLDTSRVILLEPQLSYESHLEAYGQIDLALDTFPYNGTTTTCEALYMGTPVLTFLGERCSGRVGSSLLGQVGLSAFACPSLEAYCETAIRWAGDPGPLGDLRFGLRDRFNKSTLGDNVRFAGLFFRALEEALQRGTGE